MKVPIRVRMAAWYLALLAVVMGAVGAFVIVRLRADLTSATDRSLRPALAQITAGYQIEGLTEFRDKSLSVLAGERAAAQILSRSGAVVSYVGDPVGRSPMIDRRALARVAAGQPLLASATTLGGGSGYRLAASPVVRGGRRQAVVAAVSLAPVDRSVDRVLVLLLLALPAALLATAIGGWLLARRAMQPIDRMISAAKEIGPSDLRDRLVVPGSGDELARLATALNTMLDRIQDGVARQHQLVADTSHELRTPLAVMRTDIDVSLRTDELSPAARKVLESNREELDDMIAAVEDLLTLARSDEHGLQLAREAVDLQALARQAVRRLGQHAQRRNVILAAEGAPAIVDGDPERLSQALRNLIDNAIKFGPEGGRVTVTTWQTSADAGVTVADEGPGIPDELRDRVFDRFYRIDVSRARATGGSGLGLAIVRELVIAHGGRVEVAARQPRGSAFTIALPRAGG
ncbi:MAG: sensor histidine kinase [Solirubrobacteraceae bacterium]